MYHFDSYTKDADHDSDRWATTDRGWLTVDEVMRGNYCEYPAIVNCTDTPHIHAVVFKTTTRGDHYGYKSACFATVDGAKAWMVEEVTGQLTLV